MKQWAPRRLEAIKILLHAGALAATLIAAPSLGAGRRQAVEKSEFESLYAQWQIYIATPQIQVRSSSTAYTDCPPYRSIVGLGRSALPFLIEKMRAGEASGWKQSQFFLWHAAEAISGAGLSSRAPSGSEQAMAHRYILWWDQSHKQ